MSLRRHLAPPTLVVVLLASLGARAGAQGALHASSTGAIPTPVIRECARPSVVDSAAAADDSLGMSDDSVPASALPPESGMVLIDNTGHEVHTAPAPAAPRERGSADSANPPRCASVVSSRLVTSTTP